jgi:Subtilase family
MTTGDQGLVGPRGFLDPQVKLTLSGMAEAGLDAAASRWVESGGAGYLFRERALLVRDADVDRVMASVPVVRASRLSDLNLLTFLDDETRSVEEVCEAIDRELGEGIVTPDHVLYVCPAAEPIPVPPDSPPDPPVSPAPGGGRGALVAVLDSGLLPDAVVRCIWLAGVTGDVEPHGDPLQILHPPAGHGTFAAGVVRTLAPRADLRVIRAVMNGGGAYEFDLARILFAALDMGPDVILVSFGGYSRKDNPLLGFEILEERLRSYPGAVLVAAAGNDAARRPYWPAAFPWVVSVGALGPNLHQMAWFSNYGTQVNVFAPGESLVNAWAEGEYEYIGPNQGQRAAFYGMAHWSGTDF